MGAVMVAVGKIVSASGVVAIAGADPADWLPAASNAEIVYV